MPIVKTPAADLKRRYPLYAEAGLALALGAAILAFTVPGPASEAAVLYDEPDPPIEVLAPIPQTQQHLPPPPPPAPPAPVEVPDDVQAAEVLAELDLEIERDWLPPVAVVTPPRPQVVVAPAPPAPPPPLPTVQQDVADEVFTVVERPPVLIGGIAALQAAAEYPQLAQRAQIEGRVTVQFVVDERGNVVDPVVVRSPNELLSAAALDAVGRVSFEPGQQRGRPVKVRLSVPVTFRLR